MPKKSPGGGALVPMGSANPLSMLVFDAKSQRVPAPFEGLQANACRNVGCPNFNVPPQLNVAPGRKRHEQEADGYLIVGHSTRKGQKKLRCKHCGEVVSLKSNQGIKEEMGRISYRPSAGSVSCGTKGCDNIGNSISAHRDGYQAYGRTPSGAPRYRCKVCAKTLTDSSRRRRQRKSHANRTVFMLLVNKSPIRAIARVTDLSPKAVYDKIDFIHEKCMEFVAAREARLPSKPIHRLAIGTDRQDYVLNWSDRKDRRIAKLTAVGSADNRTGYVFGMHLNFDPEADREKIEFETITRGDYGHPHPYFRRHARYWLELDHKQAPNEGIEGPLVKKADGAMRRVEAYYQDMEAAQEPDAVERLGDYHALPQHGMQVHFEYTVHAHFRQLQKLVGHAGRTRFFMDQDDTLRAGMVSAFAEEIREGRVDGFFVQIDKTYGIDTRRRMILEKKELYKKVREELGESGWPDRRVRLHMIRQQLEKLGIRKAGWRGRWIKDPEHTLNEPDKAVCWITDRGDYGLDHLAVIVSKASLHGIDRYFMQLRRMLSMLERPISTPSNALRRWYGYAPYNPEMVQKLLDIFRVHYNYCKQEQKTKTDKEGKKLPKRTPAMKLGLAKGPVRIEDILYFSGSR
jgi:transposase-like protein